MLTILTMSISAILVTILIIFLYLVVTYLVLLLINYLLAKLDFGGMSQKVMGLILIGMACVLIISALSGGNIRFWLW